MSCAGVLCKVGIEKSKAKAVIEELISDFDISEIIDYAYSHNIYGCERRRYIKKKEWLIYKTNNMKKMRFSGLL